MTETKMRATTILAIVVIVAALAAVKSLIPTQQVSAAGMPGPFGLGGQEVKAIEGDAQTIAHNDLKHELQIVGVDESADIGIVRH